MLQALEKPPCNRRPPPAAASFAIFCGGAVLLLVLLLLLDLPTLQCRRAGSKRLQAQRPVQHFPCLCTHAESLMVQRCMQAGR